ncbi:MAG: hypothetical protein Q8K40_03465 [Ignavibacteria bacterium]|nr:hypothetical protein [Ignavibacteria bacterium]
MKSLLFVLITISIFSSHSSAQSQFIEKDGLGGLVFASTTSDDYGNAVGGGVGISLGGYVDLGFSIAKASAGKVNKEVTGGHIGIFLSKAKANFSLDVGYMNGIGYHNLLVGFNFGKNFKLLNNLQIQPVFSYHLAFLSGESNTPPSSSFGVSLDFLIAKHFVVSPNFGSVNNTMFGGLSVGLFFGS